MPAGDGGQGEGSGSDAEGCKRTCTNDACKGTLANPIPRGMQWVVKERESTLGCCANKGGMCDLCCPPGASEVAPPPLRESASGSTDSSGGSGSTDSRGGGSGSMFCDGETTEWDAESKSCVPKKVGGVNPADFCGEGTKWDAAKQKCVGGVEAAGAGAGGETDNNNAAGSEEASEGGSGSGSGSGSGASSEISSATDEAGAKAACKDHGGTWVWHSQEEITLKMVTSQGLTWCDACKGGPYPDSPGGPCASASASASGSGTGSGSGSGSGSDGSANTTTYHKFAEGGCADVRLGSSVGDCPTSLLVKEGQLATGSCASQGYTKAGATVAEDTGHCGTIHFKTFEKVEEGAVVKAALAAAAAAEAL